jgi:hypothetical protein
LCGLHGRTIDELGEAAVGLVLVDEREVVAIEPREELVPADRLERSRAAEAREVDAQDARVLGTPGCLDACRMSAPLLHPVADLVVIDRRLC